MRKINLTCTKWLFLFLCTFVFSILLLPAKIAASPVRVNNEDTPYAYVLDDQADFFTDANEKELKSLMSNITDYCNVALVTTTSHNSYSTEDFAADYYDEAFGPGSSGTIFVIDRCLNEI